LSALPTTIAEAKAIQDRLARSVVLQDSSSKVQWIAGVDVGFEDNYRCTKAAAVVLSFPGLEVIETAIARVPTAFPYVPGFLSFREIPAILPALDCLKTRPDLILCDGQGYAHPRRLGIASHLGVVLDCPTIGVAKSRLIGTHEEVPPERGKWVALMDGGEQIGAVLRSRSNVKPLYVSAGHRISLPTAIAFVLDCTTKYRLPEPTRLADKLASGKPMPQLPPRS
jgi:deoxyribonuclease V